MNRWRAFMDRMIALARLGEMCPRCAARASYEAAHLDVPK